MALAPGALAVLEDGDRRPLGLVTVNTNSLDHPRALPLYQKAGFVPVRRETHRRVLSRDRDMIDA